MSNVEAVVIIIILGISVQITRWLPFLIFDNKSKLPKIIDYMGLVLPAAMMGLLTIYCFKDYDYSNYASYCPAIIAALVVAGLHLWKKNMVLSIGLGTACYMILIHVI